MRVGGGGGRGGGLTESRIRSPPDRERGEGGRLPDRERGEGGRLWVTG